MRKNWLSQSVRGGLVLISMIPVAGQADIHVIPPLPADNPLSRLDLTVGGSIRPQFNHSTGVDDKSYKRNGFDGGSRFRFGARYRINPDLSWINYYEPGVNIPAVLKWDHHYQPGAHNTTRRQMYTGLESKTWGRLTFGQQNSIYYDVVGAKTDIWDDDMLAQGPGVGINGDYDGTHRARKLLKYEKSVGPVDVYAGYLFTDNNYYPGNGLAYKRQGGGSLGADYHITPQLSWGVAWSYTKAAMRNPATGQSRDYNQNLLGTALSWKPDNWIFAMGGGWYQNFAPTKKVTIENYFAGSSWGTEYFAGYKFHIKHYGIKTIQPYVMGDRLQFVSGRHYQRIDNGLGISFQMAYGFRIDAEHIFTSSTDNIGDLNLVRLRYDF
ncbi:porin [Tatumella sp. JGM16]|nr:porin [Tatumella sp. JGM16]MBS0892805.1 porin [Tatumella sp. JGM130]MBS0911852.1 porin [Tatumella sp. JGM91]